MPFPDELAVADIVWSLDSEQEIAVNRLWFQHNHNTGNDFDWGDALQTIADHVVSSISTVSGNGNKVTAFMHQRTGLTRVDAYRIGADGKAVDKRSNVPAHASIVGTESGQTLPPIFSAVLQLKAYAGFATHPRRRIGRLFLPVSSDSILGTDGLITSGNCNDIAAAWGAVLNDLQGMHVGHPVPPGNADDFMACGVLSRVDGAFYQLEAVSVSPKPGIQRRRMNKLVTTRGLATTIDH